MRRKIIHEGIKTKIEPLGEFPFLGSFSLFSSLYKLIEQFSGNNLRYSSFKQKGGGLNEILDYSLDNKLLQIHVPNLRLNNPEVFWNLVYLFMNDKVDYKFICPYESDLPDSDFNDFGIDKPLSSRNKTANIFASDLPSF
jgi:hypothetical protein